MKKPLLLRNLKEVMDILEVIKHQEKINVQGEWNLDQNLAHCAQSIEFAMSGYPVEKSRFFQNTIGSLVFHYFDKRGYMRHGTNDFIPGESPLSAVDEIKSGSMLLAEAINKFDAWDKPLYRHRFYGKLSKKQYARAHVMHIANHLELIQIEDWRKGS